MGSLRPGNLDPDGSVHGTVAAEEWEGLFDEMLLFDVALAEEDIQSLMENGLEDTLAVEPAGKLTTNWGKIKSGRTQSR